MTIKFGDISADQIIENEYRIGVLEGMVEWILTNNNAFVKDLTPELMSEIRSGVVAKLREKYPNSGIELREGRSK